MSGKKKAEKLKEKLVDLNKLSIGIDMSSGHVVIGVADDDGSIDVKKSKDITEDFYSLVMTIGELRAKGMTIKEKESANPKIIIPTAKDITDLGRK